MHTCLYTYILSFQSIVALSFLLALTNAMSQYGLFDDIDGYGYARPPIPYARPLGPYGGFPGAFGGPLGPAGLGGYGPIPAYPPSTYQFGYGVQSGDYFGAAEYGHNEEHTPYGTVGSYHVNAPGSFQHVSYNVLH
jgi:hypothetical protein